VLSERSAGANRLLRDGATPVTETLDLAAVPALADALHRAAPRFSLAGPPPRHGAAPTPDATLRHDTAAILRLVGHDPTHPDRLAAALHLSPAPLAAGLAELELAGLVRSLPGGLVVRDARRPTGAHTAATGRPRARLEPATEGD
jgi:predicted Rossmann fold nucleotide-binding protein DprA/Smf involved in DNA uptake